MEKDNRGMITKFDIGDSFVIGEKTVYVGRSTAMLLNTSLGLVEDGTSQSAL